MRRWETKVDVHSKVFRWPSEFEHFVVCLSVYLTHRDLCRYLVRVQGLYWRAASHTCRNLRSRRKDQENVLVHTLRSTKELSAGHPCTLEETVRRQTNNMR